MTNAMDVVNYAKSISDQSGDTKVWVVLIILGMVLAWFMKQSRERENTLRAELATRTATQEEQNKTLATLVGQNTEVIRANSHYLDKATDALTEAQKTLSKFSS